MKACALEALAGVGDPDHEWHEFSGYAYHIRRLLTKEEQIITGPAIDCRGTGDWTTRYYAAIRDLPESVKLFALEEL